MQGHQLGCSSESGHWWWPSAQGGGQGDGEEGKGKASYKVRLTNYMVLAFKEKTILVEKIFSPLIHPSLE